jgi:hypothetical protein
MGTLREVQDIGSTPTGVTRAPVICWVARHAMVLVPPERLLQRAPPRATGDRHDVAGAPSSGDDALARSPATAIVRTSGHPDCDGVSDTHVPDNAQVTT